MWPAKRYHVLGVAIAILVILGACGGSIEGASEKLPRVRPTIIANSTLETAEDISGDSEVVSQFYRRSAESASNLTHSPSNSTPDSSSQMHASEISTQMASQLIVESSESWLDLLPTSLSYKDCVVRGLVENTSDTWYARDVSIMASSLDKSTSVEWRWPLTVKPGETAPFELTIEWPTASPYSWFGEPEMWTDFVEFEISAEGTEVPDPSRAFSKNYDETQRNYGNNKYYPFWHIFQDRFYSLRGTDIRYRLPRSHVLIHQDQFNALYPREYVVSDDIGAAISIWEGPLFSEVHYVPSETNIGSGNPGEEIVFEDIRVYQAIIERIDNGSLQEDRVIDVRELLPFVMEENRRIDEENKDYTMIPVGGHIGEPLSINSGYPTEQFNILSLVPGTTLDDREFQFLPNRRAFLWIGDANNVNPWSYQKTTFNGFGNVSRDGVESAPCDPRTGGLTWTNVYLKTSELGSDTFVETGTPMGYFGVFDAFESSPTEDEGAVDGVVSSAFSMLNSNVGQGPIAVDHDTVHITNGVLRGLIHNTSSYRYARNVEVGFRYPWDENVVMVWQWPLTMQPGERAPFEIPISNDTQDPEGLSIIVSALMSDVIDVSRAFQVLLNNVGTVGGFVGPVLYNPTKNSFYYLSDLGIPGVYATFRPIVPLHFSIEEFLATYPEIVVMDSAIEAENSYFYEYHAEIEVPDSHPSLRTTIRNQHISELKAYVATFDSNGRVVDVEMLQPFTDVYQASTDSMELLEVNSIPSPDVRSPSAVRLLVTLPRNVQFQDSTPIHHQVWIGGSS